MEASAAAAPPPATVLERALEIVPATVPVDAPTAEACRVRFSSAAEAEAQGIGSKRPQLVTPSAGTVLETRETILLVLADVIMLSMRIGTSMVVVLAPVNASVVQTPSITGMVPFTSTTPTTVAKVWGGGGTELAAVAAENAGGGNFAGTVLEPVALGAPLR